MSWSSTLEPSCSRVADSATLGPQPEQLPGTRGRSLLADIWFQGGRFGHPGTTTKTTAWDEKGSQKGRRSRPEAKDFAGLLVTWFADLLVCWSAGLLVCWSAGLLVCWFASLLACWSAGLLICWSAGQLVC